MDSDGTAAYEGGGYSFSVGDNINEFGGFYPVTNVWTPLAPVPDLNNLEASCVYAPSVNKLFVFGGSRFSTAPTKDCGPSCTPCAPATSSAAFSAC